MKEIEPKRRNDTITSSLSYLSRQENELDFTDKESRSNYSFHMSLESS